MRLIDADATIQRLKEWNTDDPMDKALYSFAVNRLNEQPTIEGRKTGRWIPKDDGRYHCSSCDGIAPKGYRWDFCPNCGARMVVNT